MFARPFGGKVFFLVVEVFISYHKRSKQASEQIQVFNIEFNIFSQSNSTYLIYRIQEEFIHILSSDLQYIIN